MTTRAESGRAARQTGSAPVRALDELAPADAGKVGGKAWNCARLRRHGFPVPDGLAIPSDATSAQLADLRNHAWFDRWPLDQLFAVRSSGLSEDAPEQSFAGIHETHLNVSRADVPAAVADCRASSDSERARAYRRARALPEDATAAGVLIQCMVPAVSAGVGFTVDPLTGDGEELVINAARGLGTSVVDGQIDPDEIRVRKRDGQVLSYRVGGGADHTATRHCLAEDQIRQLWSLLVGIEKHYSAPQDVEWCFDGARFWIVQSRPVTVAPKKQKDTEWTRANIAEVLPELTSPQALHASEEFLRLGQMRSMGSLLAPEKELGPIVKSFNGRLYFNLSQMRHVMRLAGSAPADFLKSFGHSGSINLDDETVGHRSIGEIVAIVPQLARMLGRHLRANRLMRAHEAIVDEFTARLASRNPETLTDPELWVEIAAWRDLAPRTIEVILVFGGVLFYELQLKKLCARNGFSYERLIGSHLAAGERSVSAQQAFDLVALADVARSEPRVADYLVRSDSLANLREVLAGTEFLKAFDEFLDTYGHRGFYETDWSLPRFREDPAPILNAVRLHLQEDRRERASEVSARASAEATQVWSEFEQSARGIRRLGDLPRARWLLARIKQYYLSREKCRSDMVRTIAAVRQWHLVLARRFVDRGWLDARDDYFLLTLEEIAVVIARPELSSELRGIAADRASELQRFKQVPMPLLMRESDLPRLVRAAGVGPQDKAGDLRGLPVSLGCVEGEVVVIDHPGDFSRMKPGAILVTRATDPSWTPLFSLASGVIVELGGMLSHASTIAREYGLPALANVPQVTRRLRTGDWITLNATEGFIRRRTGTAPHRR